MQQRGRTTPGFSQQLDLGFCYQEEMEDTEQNLRFATNFKVSEKRKSSENCNSSQIGEANGD